MDCPYCFSDIVNEAVVCKVCKRDIYLFKPLQARIAELEAQLLEVATAQADRAVVEDESSLSLINQTEEKNRIYGLKKGCVEFFIYLCLPFLVLLAAHGIITIVYDTKMIYLRIISLIVPLLFGYVLFAKCDRKFWPWLVGAIFLSLAAVMGMSGLTSLVDHSPILPQSLFEWRELLEYSVSICFSFLTGIFLGMTVYASKQPSRSERASPFIKMMLRLVRTNGRSRSANQALLKKMETYGSAFVTILSTMFAIYTGLKRFIG